MGELTAKMKRRIRNKLSGEKPTVWIGKSQVSQRVLSEIEKQLDKREMVKVKILKSALQKDRAKLVASKIAEKTDATLVDVRGHTFMLYKHRERRGEK